MSYFPLCFVNFILVAHTGHSLPVFKWNLNLERTLCCHCYKLQKFHIKFSSKQWIKYEKPLTFLQTATLLSGCHSHSRPILMLPFLQHGPSETIRSNSRCTHPLPAAYYKICSDSFGGMTGSVQHYRRPHSHHRWLAQPIVLHTVDPQREVVFELVHWFLRLFSGKWSLPLQFFSCLLRYKIK